MAWMAGQSRVIHFADFRTGSQPTGDFPGGFFLLFEAYGKGFQAAQHQPAIERGQRCACGQPDSTEPVGNDVRAADHKTGDGIVMPREKFRCTVEHDVGAEFQRSLENRRQKRVVDD